MSTYADNIVFGIISFPLIAFLITLPYMIYQYRKFGSIPWMRTLVVYSFVFYLLVAYYMVILPLPEDRTAVVAYAAHPQFVPFRFVQEFLAETTFSLSDPSTWLAALLDPYVYEAIFNVLLLVPLGMYLRYYFRRTWWQTLLIGFAMTLFYETSQITGLWGLYEHPFRLFDVDDLLLNTLGAMVGFWIAGPALRVLPDIRVVNEEAREAGMRASATKRALSFFIDVAIACVATMIAGALRLMIVTGEPLPAEGWFGPSWIAGVTFAAFFIAVPVLAGGRTLAQRLLKLRIVRPDATPARWYQILARYGLLALLIWAPFALLVQAPFVLLAGVVNLNADLAGEIDALMAFAVEHHATFVWVWIGFMAVWTASLVIRAVRAAAKKQPFVMLNGLLSNTRVMTEAGVTLARERRIVLDVDEVAALERTIAEEGTPLIELMERAGDAVADEVRAWVPDPAPVVVLTGSGNNGGDGWVVARTLAEAGYSVTLVAPELAERLHAEPARSTALAAFSDASARNLPLRVLIAPNADVLAKAIDDAEAIVDAMLGTGFSGDEMRPPYAGWIETANRRRFEGRRSKGRGQHRKRQHERGEHVRSDKKRLPVRAKDAPFAVAVDVPSGLSAQTGRSAKPCFAADVTVTMLAFKPGLVAPEAAGRTGIVKLAKLVDAKPYRKRLAAASGAPEA